ncbi:MAG: LysE family translocator [Halomonas sp.]|jgi:threonine/homoserine/homoserine lactone efflux protein|uniref:LysE family translocator n=1 Tax=Billgrantia tianxiuensis TaxID=2497861 RepID=A0A6I6SMG5_9GAMM|nr:MULTISPECIES: LysE family translocator [Halomonas]MCE8032221.1 LysE family translocator [Halomonas sp. MCCC 1A11057]MDX5434375.1 LysE family translocator [Halomonas sp.]MDX5503883.1 LysE family translocator [Halomonas sp.]QHC49766.1 LysE family translocator [Halomonas tianxiuensis]
MEALAFLGPAALYMISMTITPGPNNVMLTASGANYGFMRTLPHMFGILGGCFLLFSGIALGLGLIFERYPAVQMTLRVIGSAYLLYLAWKIATAPPPDLRHKGEGRPLSFWQAAAFQFANPKAWVMGLALMAGFLPQGGDTVVNALLLAGFAELVALPCIAVWAGFGMALGQWLDTPRAWRIFNWTMGGLTAACVIFILG